MAGGATVDPSRSGPQRVEGPVAGVEAEAAVHRLPGADRLDARDDVCWGGHQGREVRNHEDDEADQGDRPQDREDGSSSGRGRGRPVGPRRRREAAAWTEVSSEQGATARARPSYRRGGPVRRGRRGGHCRCAAPRTETTLENRAATDALHPFAHEGPALFNAAVRGHTKADETRNPSAKIYIDSVGCAALRPARGRLRERGGMTAWSTRREASGTAKCGSRRFGRRRSISGETISSKSRGNERPPPKGRRSSSPCPEATIFRTRRSASSVLSRSPTIRTSARLSRTRSARSSRRARTLRPPRNQTAAFKSNRAHPSQPFCTRIRGEYHGPVAEAGPWLSRLGPRGHRGIFREGPRGSSDPVPLDHVPVHLGSAGRRRSASRDDPRGWDGHRGPEAAPRPPDRGDDVLRRARARRLGGRLPRSSRRPLGRGAGAAVCGRPPRGDGDPERAPGRLRGCARDEPTDDRMARAGTGPVPADRERAASGAARGRVGLHGPKIKPIPDAASSSWARNRRYTRSASAPARACARSRSFSSSVARATPASLPSTRTYRSSPGNPRLFASLEVMLWRLTRSSFQTTSARDACAEGTRKTRYTRAALRRPY